MQAVANSFDGIIDTVSAQHDISQLLPLLKVCSGSQQPIQALPATLSKRLTCSNTVPLALVRESLVWSCKDDLMQRRAKGVRSVACTHCPVCDCRPMGG